ncbi:hypothetical protein EBZ80_25730 [bacterium]|nr:hypothetical protein [bacterium]
MPISSAAAYAGCSRRYVERLLKTDFAKDLERKPDGTIRADQLKGLCDFLSNCRRRGRRFGTKFLFRLPPTRKGPTDEWRMHRSLKHLGEMSDPNLVQKVMLTALARYKALGGTMPA